MLQRSTGSSTGLQRPGIRLLPTVGFMAALALMATVASLTASVGPLIAPAQAEVTKASPAAKPAAARPPAPPAITASRAEAELVADLGKRRKALDEQARKLELRERLLDAAEKRLDGKMAQLRSLEASLKQLSVARDEETNKQMASLVKMYETMKPKDAARIFERLELPIQLAVSTRMKEAKMAAILAEMSPEVAKVLTTALAGKARTASATDSAPPAASADAAAPAKPQPAAKPATAAKG